MNDFNTIYTPDLNVGINNLILGETIDSSSLIITGRELSIKNNINYLNYLELNNQFEYNSLYLKEYDKTVFEKNPELEFNSSDKTLTKITCLIKINLKDDILTLLNSKYGPNRNYEWNIRGIYRTEIENEYGTISIYLNEYTLMIMNKFKGLSLQMYFTNLKRTKLQINNFEQIERERREKENAFNNSLKKIFDL